MVLSLRADQGADQAFAAVLADPADSERQVIIVGGTRFILDPARELDNAIREQGKHITEIVAYDPGAMGGELRCGDGRTRSAPSWSAPGSTMAASGWASSTATGAVTSRRNCSPPSGRDPAPRLKPRPRPGPSAWFR